MVLLVGEQQTRAIDRKIDGRHTGRVCVRANVEVVPAGDRPHECGSDRDDCAVSGEHCTTVSWRAVAVYVVNNQM